MDYVIKAGKIIGAVAPAVIAISSIASNYMNKGQQHQYQHQDDEHQEGRESFESHSQPNLDFYKNRIPSQPNGDYIENILESWSGNYDQLKSHSGYIQWLFPNREPGLNPKAFCLKRDEAQAIRSDPVLRDRVRRAFLMILDLYGMTLSERNEFQIKENDPQYLEHFISHSVSSMWVSRILKALRELGHKELMLPWLQFLAMLIYQRNVVPARFRKSFTKFWVQTLDTADQKSLEGFYQSVSENEN